MTVSLETPPILSTPDTHIFEDPNPTVTTPPSRRLSEEQLFVTYEIQRTVKEIRQGRWRRIALQFPDQMLEDAPRVFEALSRGLKDVRKNTTKSESGTVGNVAEDVQNGVEKLEIAQCEAEDRLYILADTSYGACCVDEIAAEHVDADVVVHYGRACLSPTARLPVIYVFTLQSLSLESLVGAFQRIYPDYGSKVILMADVTYSNHIPEVYARLKATGYTNIFATSIIHRPSSPLPNRTVPDDVAGDDSILQYYQLFHISQPPSSLLLTLSSRVKAIHIYTPSSNSDIVKAPLLATTSHTLRRRYALITSLSTVPIFGILINTLSVKNYLHIVERVKARIVAAGKKSYTFVVGKINAAKIANFSEIGGWVVIGCWESSLVESKDFWRPVITPFELEVALKDDGERIWTGEWRADWQDMLDGGDETATNITTSEVNVAGINDDIIDGGELDSEPESAPPEFDLRTGRYVSHTRPMLSPSKVAAPSKQFINKAPSINSTSATKTLMKRANGDLVTIGGQVSPGAEFLRTQRTWKGLGSDFEIAYENEIGADRASIEQGRSGIARGYRVGEEGNLT